MVSCISLVTLPVGGVSDWNIPSSRSNRDIKCDLEVAASACIPAMIFGDHNTSRLKTFSTLSLHSTKYLLHLKK